VSAQSNRPPIERVRTAAELRKWYWLKSELVNFARISGIAYDCNKPELVARLCHWIETGEKTGAKIPRTKPRPISKFDWGKERLTGATEITDSYRNTQNVRRFMQSHAAEHFAFSNEFMAWMRDNHGRTLQDAIDFWLHLDAKKKHGYRENIPGISASELRSVWAKKRALPGPHVYKKGDENL